MTNENLVKELKDRYRRLLSNGRNSESFGIMRKLRRKINRAKAGIAIAQRFSLDSWKSLPYNGS